MHARPGGGCAAARAARPLARRGQARLRQARPGGGPRRAARRQEALRAAPARLHGRHPAALRACGGAAPLDRRELRCRRQGGAQRRHRAQAAPEGGGAHGHGHGQTHITCTRTRARAWASHLHRICTACAPHLHRWTAARRSMCSRASCSAPRRAAASAPPPTPVCESRRRIRSAAPLRRRAVSRARCRRPSTASSVPTPRPSSCRRARSWPGTWPCIAPPRSWSPSAPRSSRGSSRCSVTRACPTGCGPSSPRPSRCVPSATAPSRRSARARPRCCARTSGWCRRASPKPDVV